MSTACTVRGACTPARGSCTSSLRCCLRRCLPLCCRSRRRDVGNPREHTSPAKSQYPSGFFPLSPAALIILQVSGEGISCCCCIRPLSNPPHLFAIQSPFSAFRVHLSSLEAPSCTLPLCVAQKCCSVREAGKDPYIPSGELFWGLRSSDFSLEMSGPHPATPTGWSHGR